MSGYRRFIAYVYEYRKGKKGGNCGFLKVEVKNQRCRIELHLHCVGIPPQVECRTYGFLRKDGLMNGILLGNCRSEADTVECVIETDASNMAESGIPFGKLGGIVLLTEPGGFLGTEWDDQPVRPDNFRELKRPIESEEIAAVENKRSTPKPSPAATTANLSENFSKETEDPGSAITIESITEEIAPEEITAKTVPATIPEPSAEKSTSGIITETITEESASGVSTETITKESASGVATKAITEESASDITIETIVAESISPTNETAPSSQPPTEEISANKNSSPSTTAATEIPTDASEAPTSPANSTASTNPTESIHSTESKEPNPPFRFPVEEFSPFDDVEFVKCWKIQPADLGRCASRIRTLRNNRFLQYGYYNFGHLLLAQRPGGRFVLGVPGGYDQQERFMANMFGFPYFKECRAIELPRNRGGYWYRLIDAPNFR